MFVADLNLNFTIYKGNHGLCIRTMYKCRIVSDRNFLYSTFSVFLIRNFTLKFQDFLESTKSKTFRDTARHFVDPRIDLHPHIDALTIIDRTETIIVSLSLPET
jgi:sorbitol-specific phosphotransferase system component IIC